MICLHALTIHFKDSDYVLERTSMSSTPLIQISLLRTWRNKKKKNLRLSLDLTGNLHTGSIGHQSISILLTSPEKPRIAAELRLRVVPSDDSAPFESRSDVLRLNGEPFQCINFTCFQDIILLCTRNWEWRRACSRRLGCSFIDFSSKIAHWQQPYYRPSCQHLHTFKLNDTFIV